MTGTLRTMFIAFLGLFHKVYACGTLAGIVLTTTKVNEFLSAMNRVRAPKKLVIPMAVMLRYIPTIQEDWRYIKDAMRMRDVSPSLASFLAHPGITVECIYVPLLMAASKAADDLSVASVTRGIENPNPRTCLVQIKCGISDWVVMAVAVAYLIFELCVRGGVIAGTWWAARHQFENFGRRMCPVLWPQWVRKDNDHTAGERLNSSILSRGTSWPCAGRWSGNQQYPYVSDCR